MCRTDRLMYLYSMIFHLNLQGLLAMQSLKMSVGFKIMGEIKRKSFRDACSKRFRSGEWDMKFGRWEEKCVELCVAWQNNISDPEWRPFK